MKLLRTFLNFSAFIIVMKIPRILSILLIVTLGSTILFSFFSVSPWARIYDKQSLLPDSIVSLTSGYAVIVDKKAQKLYVFGKKEHLQKVFEARCSTGKNQGSKVASGDSRTPEGIFFPTKKFTKDLLTPIYGDLAFTLDYPNFLDKKIGRSGHGIWIHGTDKPLRPFQSNGCVVLDNGDIVRLSEFMYLNKTPVIIVDTIKWVSFDDTLALKKEIESAMMLWKKRVMDGLEDVEDYIYVINSVGENISVKRFADHMRHLRTLNRHFFLEPKDISILKQDDNAVILFDQIISVENSVFQGVYMKLFLEKKKKNCWLAMKELPQKTPTVYLAQLPDSKQDSVSTLPSASRTDAVKSPDKNILLSQQENLAAPKSQTVPLKPEQQKPAMTVAGTQPPSDSTIDEKAIQILISRWSKSWESGNMQVYQDCYAKEFSSRHMDLKKWVKYKEGLNKRYKSIQINILNVTVKVDAHSNNGTATFTQKYRAPGMNDTGIKELQLKKIAGVWKIRRETMRK